MLTFASDSRNRGNRKDPHLDFFLLTCHDNMLDFVKTLSAGLKNLVKSKACQEKYI